MLKLCFYKRPKDLNFLKKEVKAIQSFGLDIKFKQDDKLGFPNDGYFELKNQAKFHPLKFLFALAKKASENGGLIFEHTPAQSISSNSPYIVKTPGGQIQAKSVILATYSPFNKPLELFFKQGKYISYIIDSKIPKGRLPEGIYEDFEEPYHYFRLDTQKDHNHLILGGEDHRKELKIDPNRNFNALIEFFGELFPDLELKLVRKWQGPISN